MDTFFSDDEEFAPAAAAAAAVQEDQTLNEGFAKVNLDNARLAQPE